MSSIIRVIQVLSFVAAFAAAKAQPAVYRLADLQQRISHPDTLYVVNFWATWCKPCIRELPSFDSLAVLHKNEPVRVLLVSVDFVEELHSRVIPFLRQRKIGSEVVLLDEPNGNVFINAISPNWSGAIPATLIRHGRYNQLYEGSLTLSDLEDLLVKTFTK